MELKKFEDKLDKIYNQSLSNTRKEALNLTLIFLEFFVIYGLIVFAFFKLIPSVISLLIIIVIHIIYFKFGFKPHTLKDSEIISMMIYKILGFLKKEDIKNAILYIETLIVFLRPYRVKSKSRFFNNRIKYSKIEKIKKDSTNLINILKKIKKIIRKYSIKKISNDIYVNLLKISMEIYQEDNLSSNSINLLNETKDKVDQIYGNLETQKYIFKFRKFLRVIIPTIFSFSVDIWSKIKNKDIFPYVLLLVMLLVLPTLLGISLPEGTNWIFFAMIALGYIGRRK